MINTLTTTGFNFRGQQAVYRGKVRDVYTLDNDILILIATDRISAFDVVMPKGIPYKGQVLNEITTRFMKDTEAIVPNWLLATPDPNVAIGQLCKPFKIEMVIRGYLSGHAWRVYKSGRRSLCGISMPDGMKENDKFPEPIITPATKAEQGAHDEDISKKAILEQGIVSASDYQVLESYTRTLFEKGTETAANKGLILADTKYEFGKTKKGDIVLIDEIHTPDSSRYFYADTYQQRQQQGQPQRQLSKEFLRRWLLSKKFWGAEGQVLPEMSDDFVTSVSERYIELYEQITGDTFIASDTTDIEQRIADNIVSCLNEIC